MGAPLDRRVSGHLLGRALSCCTDRPGRSFQDRNMGLTCVELARLELATPCLQSDVSTCGHGADLASGLPVSDRSVPLVTVLNGTLMARDLGRVMAYLPAGYP